MRDRKFVSQKNQTSLAPKIGYGKIIISIFLIIVLSYFGYTAFNLLNFSPESKIKSSVRVRFSRNDEIDKTVVVLLDGNKDIAAANIYNINTQKNVQREILIPSWVYVAEYSGNYDTKISVKDLGYVGRNINPQREQEYIIWQLQNIVASDFDNYFILDSEAINIMHVTNQADKNAEIDEAIAKLNLTYIISESGSVKSLNSHIFTNLNPVQIYQTLMNIQYSANENTVIDLRKDWALLDELLPNGKSIKTYNYINIDDALAKDIEMFKPLNIGQEQVKVEVYNGSGVPKSALRYSRSIENLGAKVVRTGNAPSDIDKTVIYVSNKNTYKNSLNLVEGVFVSEPEVIEGRPTFMTTGDIVIVLGKDIQKEIEWK